MAGRSSPAPGRLMSDAPHKPADRTKFRLQTAFRRFNARNHHQVERV
jgi:hypothetical protein